MILGKLIAGAIGLLTGGLFGLILGLIVGHFFDRALGQVFNMASAESLARVQEGFFETVFLLCGYLAKADGRVSEDEIAHTEQLFVQMGLSGDQRKLAIELFRRGSAEGFDAEAVARSFASVAGHQRQLLQTLLLFLISLAHADQTLAPTEHAALVRIAIGLGLDAMQLEALLNMARAQSHFHSTGGAADPQDQLRDAYGALGVNSSVSDAELKRAYRKLMSEHHPDKLIAKGVPEQMVKLATERAQEIQAAYALLRRHRAGK